MHAALAAALLLAAAAQAQTGPLPLTPALLRRWGYESERAAALPPPERAALQEQLTALEAGRLRKLELLRRARPDGWRSFVDAGGMLTPEGHAIVDAYLAALGDRPLAVPAGISGLERADGKPLTPEDFERLRAVLDRTFDGVAGLGDKSAPGTELIVDARVRNETVHSVILTNPRTGLTAEVGQLYVDGRRPMAARSWYGSLQGAWDSKPDSWVDYRFKAQVGWVDLRSRYFASAPDNSAGDRLLELGGKLGVPRDKLDQARRYMTYDDPYQAHGMVVTSLLTELGRAYNLFGPLDLSWTVGNLTKTAWLAPNTAFDETLGLRVRLNDGLSVGIFGGAVQNLSPVGSRLLQEAAEHETIKPGFNLEVAPHVSAAVWGRAPGVSDITFSARATQRYNRDTRASEIEAGLATTFLSHPLGLSAAYSRETGAEIGFDREKARVQLDYRLTDRILAYMAYERDRIKYGNAKVESDAFLVGVEATLGGGRGVQGSLAVDHLFGGGYRDASDPLRPAFEKVLGKLNQGLVAGMGVADRADAVYRETLRDDIRGFLGGLDALSLALQRLDPEAADELLDELSSRGLSEAQRAFLQDLWLRTVSPSSERHAQIREAIAQGLGAVEALDDASAYYREHRGEIRELIGLLTDQNVWNAVAVQTARAQLVQAMGRVGKIGVKIPGLGGELTVKLDAPAVIAAGHILNSRLSPIAAARPEDVERLIVRQGAQALGLDPATASQEAVLQALLAQGDAQLRQQLADRLGPLLERHRGAIDGARLASQILDSLPPQAAELLKQRYGLDLKGLLPADMGYEELRALLLTTLPDRLMALLREKYGDEMARGMAAMLSWAGELMSREINMQLIQMMLAAEELNRLSVDKGRKINDLDLRFAMRSFDMLDARGRARAADRLRDAKAALVQEAALEEGRLLERMTAQGRAQLDALQLDPAWPAGLRVRISDASMAPLLSYYGDGPVFALLERIRAAYAARPVPGGRTVVLELDEAGLGTSVRSAKGASEVKLSLSRPKDARDAAFKLEGLERYAVGD